MKIFTDGSLVGRTAAMTAPYAGEAGDGNRGYLQGDAGRLTDAIVAAHRAGWRVAAHAIGDRAIDLALDAFAVAAAGCPRPDPRHRIEHFAAARPDQVARAAALGVIPVGQGRFATEIGDGMLVSVGPERHSWLYRQRSLLEAGIVLAGSSDRPVVTGTPLLGIHDMVNRRTAAGAPFNAGEAVTAAQALRAYTWGSAYASKAEQVKGSIEVGKLADLAVLVRRPDGGQPGPDRRPGGHRDDRRRRGRLLRPRLTTRRLTTRWPVSRPAAGAGPVSWSRRSTGPRTSPSRYGRRRWWPRCAAAHGCCPPRSTGRPPRPPSRRARR